MVTIPARQRSRSATASSDGAAEPVGDQAGTVQVADSGVESASAGDGGSAPSALLPVPLGIHQAAATPASGKGIGPVPLAGAPLALRLYPVRT